MVDKISLQRHSWNMSRIRSSNTKLEIAVRSVLHRNGFRFTVNEPLNKKLPGKPDVVLPRCGTIIFVHGCFWHGHENCNISRIPKTRTDWWKSKIGKNQDRDNRVRKTLVELEWNVLTIWECEIKEDPALKELILQVNQKSVS
jgi:DNA mismatch endonuclease (patch repair protein)